jgi:hypothetical protein
MALAVTMCKRFDASSLHHISRMGQSEKQKRERREKKKLVLANITG